jgi:hypothetical protein
MQKMMAELRRGAEGGGADSAGAARADEVLEATFELQSAQSRARLLETQRDQVQARLEDEAHKLQVRRPLL